MTFVKATPIIGTDQVVFSAWEPYSCHATVMHYDDGHWYGRVGTKPPLDLEGLPLGSDERKEKVEAHYSAEKHRAIAIIIAHEPRLEHDGRIDFGSGEIWIGREDLV